MSACPDEAMSFMTVRASIVGAEKAGKENAGKKIMFSSLNSRVGVANY